MESVLDFIHEASTPHPPYPGEETARKALDPYCRKVAEALSDAFLDEFWSALGKLQDCYTGEAFRRGFCLGAALMEELRGEGYVWGSPQGRRTSA